MRRILIGMLVGVLVFGASGAAFSGGNNLPTSTVQKQISEMDCKELRKLDSQLRLDKLESTDDLGDIRSRKTTVEGHIKKLNEQVLKLTKDIKAESDSGKKKKLERELKKVKRALNRKTKEREDEMKLETKESIHLRNIGSDLEQTRKYLKKNHCI